jgi:hypothetical protein
MKSDCDGKVMVVGAVRFQVARDCSGETEPGFDVIEASLPWLVGGSTTWKPINRAYQGLPRGEIHSRTGSCSPLPPAQNISVR